MELGREFTELTENEMLETDGGLVVLGIAITTAVVVKATVAVVAVGGAFALGVYNGKKTEDRNYR